MSRHKTITALTLTLAAALSTPAAQAQSLTTLYAFAGVPDAGWSDAGPLYRNGKLYGTTFGGGQYGHGTVFELDPATGTETILHSFTSGADGDGPKGALIEHDGQLYGTTYYGGTAGSGTLFVVDPATSSEKVLYSFADAGDGYGPSSGLLYHDGVLYGTTVGGGEVEGIVFAFNLASGTETVLHSFSVFTADGAVPYSGLTYLNGTLYGTTSGGGTAGKGAIYSIDLATGTEKLLYSFSGHSDGASPESTLTAVNGYLYGTAFTGGSAGDGTLFRFDPATGELAVLHTFTGAGDGWMPQGKLAYRKGSLYGTTFGGSFSKGTVFKLDLATNTETILYNFSGGSDGLWPAGEMAIHQGQIFGTTYAGGAHNYGTVFQLTP